MCKTFHTRTGTREVCMTPYISTENVSFVEHESIKHPDLSHLLKVARDQDV